MTSNHATRTTSDGTGDTPTIAIEIERVESAEIVRVRGRLNWATVAQLRKVAVEISATGPVVIDLTGLESSDSAGTATLLSIMVRAHEQGQRLALVVADDVLWTILMSLEAHLLVPIVTSEAQALASLGVTRAA
jgi:anti-anti-sigma factor